MLLQATLNGALSNTDHPSVPVSLGTGYRRPLSL